MSTPTAEIQTTDSIFYHLTETGQHHCCTATDVTACSVMLSPAIKKKLPVAEALTNQKPTHRKQFCFSIIPVNTVKQAYTANCNSASTFYCTVTLLLRSKCHMSDTIPMRDHVRYIYEKCLCMKIRLLGKH